MTQSALLDVVNEKSKGMKTGFMQEKDLKDQNVNDIQKFVDFLFSYNILAQFQGKFIM